jgi:hypothetical protein
MIERRNNMMISTALRIGLGAVLAGALFGPASSVRADSYSFGATQGAVAPRSMEQAPSTPLGAGQPSNYSFGATQTGTMNATGNSAPVANPQANPGTVPGGGASAKPLISEIGLPAMDAASKGASGQGANAPDKPGSQKAKWEASEFDATKNVSSGQNANQDSQTTSEPKPGHRPRRVPHKANP